MRNISISGKMAAGKDTLATRLMNDLNASGKDVTYKIVKFADPLYELCNYWGCSHTTQMEAAHVFVDRLLSAGVHMKISDRTDFTHAFVLACSKLAPKNANDKPRELLQFIGTDIVRRRIDPDAWVKLFIKDIELLNHNNIFAICSDMRFQNEFNACKDRNFIVIRIRITKKLINKRYRELYGRTPTASVHTHPSETDLDHIPIDDWHAWLEACDTQQIYDKYGVAMEYIRGLALTGKGAFRNVTT